MAKKISKRYKQALEKVPKGKVQIAEAVEIIKGFNYTKFDQTVELVLHLGIDPKQVDQQLRGSVSLPNGLGVSRKVIAFCDGADVDKAKAAGAIEAGSDELIKKVNDGWLDFDVAVATPAMMKSVSKLGRVLGPQGKMPSPKAGTVMPDIEKAVREFVAGKVEYRNDDGGNIHIPVGKMSFEAKALVENVESFYNFIKKHRPTTTKGTFIKKMCLSATMSPSVRIETA